MIGWRETTLGVVAVASLALAVAQSQNSTQSLPDAPSSQPRQLPKPEVPVQLPSAGTTTDNAPPPVTPKEDSSSREDASPTPPPFRVTTTGEGRNAQPKEEQATQDDLFRLVTRVNFVLVPVTVKDSNNLLVPGLLSKDFSVYEDGQAQPISFFTSDPLPLTAAVVMDLGMPDIVVEKVNETLPALLGAFGQYDEVGLYSYDNTVKKVEDFLPTASPKLSTVFRKVQTTTSGRSGAPLSGGPMAAGPTVNGRPLDPGANQTVNAIANSPRNEARVLNDALLTAALDLSKRDRTRRKILFVISDGKEIGSDAKYTDVLKVLLSNGITVYALGVGQSALPGYKQLDKIHIPGLPYANILPKYAAATGGQLLSEISRGSIETAYGTITTEARNQYTIGYSTRATPSSTYRSIEVRVRRPNLKVMARDGYYPLPPSPVK